jgi:hypothetical protein
MSVEPDGKIIHVVFENKDSRTTTKFDFHKANCAPYSVSSVPSVVKLFPLQ